MTLQIELPHRQKISKFCIRHHIRKLSIFGSALGEDFGPESDIDILVEFEEDSVPGLLALVKMEEELSRLFGRTVDIRTPGDLSRYFRNEVLERAEVQYVAG